MPAGESGKGRDGMDLILGYGAGLLTLINPCILPVLPVVLASALQAGRAGPVALAAGMGLSFVVLGLAVAALGHAAGLTEERVAQVGAVLMVGFGLVLLLPRAGAAFASATAGMAARADAGIDRLDRGALPGQFLGGALLGAVWTPCVGPTLGGAIALASSGGSLTQAGAVMAAFAAGVATVLLALAYGARAALMRNRALMQTLSLRARPILGAVFAALGVVLLFGLQKPVETWLLDVLPIWLQDLSVSI
jgi:cytochrome c biogenesis protein CcdA